MITTLDQLTVDAFVELLSGNISILDCTEPEITKVVRNIVFEYKEIADSTGVRKYLSEIEELIKARMSVILFSICSNLIVLQEYDRVREIMAECGINATTMNDQRVAAEVSSRLERAKSSVFKIEKTCHDNKTDLSVRREFDAQTVALMTYFKLQIDTSVMKATVYAHLVARYNREIKIRLAARK